MQYNINKSVIQSKVIYVVHYNCAPIRSHSISIDIDGLGTININGDNPEQSVAKIIGYLKSQEMEEC